MTSSNPIVRNALASNAVVYSRPFLMFINNHGDMWSHIAHGHTAKAADAYAKWMKAVKDMGTKVVSDYSQEARSAAHFIQKLKEMGAISGVEWREAQLRKEAEAAYQKYFKAPMQSVVEFETAWRERQSGRKSEARPSATPKGVSDDDYLE